MSFLKAQTLLSLATLCAGQRVGVTLDDVVERYGVSLRTAQRMMQALERSFPDVGASIDGFGRKRWRLDPSGLRGLLTVTAEELAALDLSIESLVRSSQMQEARQLVGLRDKVLALMPPNKVLRLETDHEALLEAQGMATRPGPRPHSNAVVDAAIGQAIMAVRLLEVTYVSRRDSETRCRRLAPYGILSGIRRYVVARDVDAEDGRLRMFRLDAIERADVTDIAFVREPEFDLRAFANRAFGIFQSDDEYGEVVWRFSERAAEHARGFVFHPEQVLEEQPDGSLVIRFHAAGHLEMCWYLYAWGDQVEVLAPQGLKDMCESNRRSDFPAFP